MNARSLKPAHKNGVARWASLWLITCVASALMLLTQSTARPFLARSTAPNINATLSSTPSSSGKVFANIETLHVGQRVITPSCDPNHPMPTAVDRSAWKQIRLEREIELGDGLADVTHVETLQPPQWLAQFQVHPGGQAPAPLDLQEMGVEPGLFKVVAVSNCPPIEQSPGEVVLTTITHLNSFLFDLSLRNDSGKSDLIQVTGWHKLYSLNRGWTSVCDLKPGEELRGRSGSLKLATLARHTGIVPVFNLTVEHEHVYYVSGLQLLAHNNNCTPPGEYLGIKAPGQVTPGIKVLEGQYVESTGNAPRVQPWKAFYDDYGRLVGRTDYNAGDPVQGYADTHYHVYGYSRAFAPQGAELQAHVPGEYVPNQ